MIVLNEFRKFKIYMNSNFHKKTLKVNFQGFEVPSGFEPL